MSVACPVVTRSQQRNNVTSPSNSDESMVGGKKTQEGDGTYEGLAKESRAEEDVGKESGSPMSPQVSIHRNLHGPGASLSLWHKRLGVSKQRIGLMGKHGSVLGLNIKGRSPGCDRTCTCDNCRLARAARIEY